MKGLIFLLLFSFLNANFISIDEIQKAKGVIYLNLDKDLKKELLIWRQFKKDKYNNYYYLTLIDDNGKILYNSKKTTNMEDKFSFGEYDCGESIPLIALDLDGDNIDEILASTPKGDVSPDFYKVFKWDGKKLNFWFEKALYLKNNKLFWKNKFLEKEIWVTNFLQSYKDYAKVTLFKYDDKNINVFSTAIVKINKNGGKLKDILIPFTKYENCYTAKLSKKDHYNSKGKKLTKIRAILIQDRANVLKKIHIDKEDTSSDIFTTAKEREKINSMFIVPIGIKYNSLKNAILYYEPVLDICVEGNKIYIEQSSFYINPKYL
jgi:hypothetical protein